MIPYQCLGDLLATLVNGSVGSVMYAKAEQKIILLKQHFPTAHFINVENFGSEKYEECLKDFEPAPPCFTYTHSHNVALCSSNCANKKVMVYYA